MLWQWELPAFYVWQSGDITFKNCVAAFLRWHAWYIHVRLGFDEANINPIAVNWVAILFVHSVEIYLKHFVEIHVWSICYLWIVALDVHINILSCAPCEYEFDFLSFCFIYHTILIYIYIYIYIYMYMYMYMHIHMHIHMYMYICMYCMYFAIKFCGNYNSLYT